MSDYSTIKLISTIFQIYNLLLFARILSSWFPVNRSNQLYRLLYQLTEPILGPFRDVFHRFGLLSSGIDFSPIAALLVLNSIESMIVRLLL